MELRELLRLLWRRRVLLAAVVVLAIGAGAAFALLRPDRYEATATLALTPDVRHGQGLAASDSISALLDTYATIARSAAVRRRAEAALGRPLDADIETDATGGTGVLRIEARSASPTHAATAATAMAAAFRRSIAGNRLVIASLVDPAEVPTSPVQPRPALIVGVAAVLGLLGGAMLVVALDRFRRRVEGPGDVAELTDAPVIGRLPRRRALQRGPARLIWDEERAAPLQEAYRALRTNLEFLLDDASRVLQVTSPEPSEGKSTVVANLGVALGLIGVETAIVDLDFRRPRQHEIFGLDNRTGVSTGLAVRSGAPELRPSGHPNLWVVTSGPAPPDPTELLHVRAAALEQQLRGLGMLVLIDSPPLLPVNDARLIAARSDGLLLVLAAGRSRPAALRAALERLAFVGARVLGVILNEAGGEGDRRGRYGSGYYPAREPRPDETVAERTT